MPDFDVFSLLDIRRHNRRSRGKRKNGNLKRTCKHKNKTFWTKSLNMLGKSMKSIPLLMNGILIKCLVDMRFLSCVNNCHLIERYVFSARLV